MIDSTHARVLVLEDEWMIAEQLKTALISAGFEVVGPVGRNAQAISLVEDGGIDAAILDINVQGERSFAVAERLARASVPFVFVSGYSDAELPKPFRDRPLMTKPVDEASLSECVEFLLAARR